MSIFVHRDVMFEMVSYPSGSIVLFSQYNNGSVVVKEWGPRPSLMDVRRVADEYIDHLVINAKSADGDKVCDVCKEKYSNHRLFRGAFAMEERPYLTRLCRGTLVKL